MSTSSVKKDTVTLRKLYWAAGVREFWLVDAHEEKPAFEILRRAPRGYVSARKNGGWLRSEVFDRSFWFSRKADRRGQPKFVLEVK